MKSGMDYLLGQLLSLVFYIMTLIIYNRARREYVGGKIAAAINLIMIFLAILLIADTIDYFLAALLPVGADTTLIIKILFKLMALSVLFFGGLRFFSKSTLPSQTSQGMPLMEGIESVPTSPEIRDDASGKATVVLGRSTPKPKPTLGRYEIIEQIGRGAMGVVYKGRDPKLQRLTAIKTIRFIDDYDEDKVEKVKSHFYREAEVVAKLSHRNIVKIYDVGEDLDLSYLAMEYLEGDDLDKFCSQNSLLPLTMTLNIIMQVCDALDYAHAHGIVHRDIKPGNIMVLQNGEVKVTDFGIARAVGSTKTRTGTIKGTPYYMSPEQARGKTLTGSADIFSLGVVFYQLLTGKLPFEGDNLASIMYQTTNSDPESPADYNSEVGQPVMDILNRALMKDPRERYQTAGQMADALRGLIAELRPAVQDKVPGDILKGVKKQTATKLPGGDKEEGDDSQGLADRLDFSDLDTVLTMEAPKTTAEETDADVSLIRKDDDSERFGEAATLDLSDSSPRLSDTSDYPGPSTVPVLHQPKPADTRSYKVVRTLPPTLSNEQEEAVAQQADRTLATGRVGIAAQWIRRNIKLAISCLVILGGIVFGYVFFWSSPDADTRFLKSAYHKFFQSEEDKQKQRLDEQRQLVKKIMQQKLQEKQLQVSQQDQLQKTLEEQQKDGTEQQKKQQAIVRQKLEEAKKKQEAERLARIEAEKEAERKRLRAIKAKEELEKKRKADAEAKKIAEAKRIAERERQQTENRRLEEIKNINVLIAEADVNRREKRYVEAKNGYSTVLQNIEKSPFRDDVQMVAYRRTAETALKEDDIVYGSKGYVLHKEQWVTAQELEMIRFSEGYVKYKGALRDHKTLEDSIEKMTEPLMQKHLTRKYSDQTVHSKNILFKKLVLTRSNAQFSEYSVYYKWKVWTFKGMDEDICRIDIKYTVDADKWSLVKGCE